MTDTPKDADVKSATAHRPIADMRLRSQRAPVVRLSSKVLIGLGAAATIAIGGAVLLALRPPAKATKSELYNTTTSSTPDGLANLPKDYGALPPGVPKLGPPMPGDLGRAIVNAGAPAPPMGFGAEAGAGAAQDPASQRVDQEAEAARSSRLFVANSGGAAGATGSSSASPSSATVGPPSATPVVEAGSSDHKLSFLNGAADRKTVSPDRPEAPASPYVLQAGSVIAGALITGIRSDLPGQVNAQVTEDVFDSPTGRILLIPQGSRLIGQYDAQVSFGQSRALLVWTRLILPNGRSIVLERQPAADPSGQAGLSDKVDNHWGSLFKAAALSTLLSVGSEAGTSDAENSLVQAIRQGGSQSFSQVGQQVVGRSLNVQPTITVRPGSPVRVMVTRDLVLERYDS